MASFDIDLKDMRPDGYPLPLPRPVDISMPVIPKQILVTSGGAFTYDSVIFKLWTGGDGIDIAKAKTGSNADWRIIKIFIAPAGAANLFVAWAIVQDWKQQSSSGNPDQNWPEISIF